MTPDEQITCYRKALEEIKTLGRRANMFDQCARIADEALESCREATKEAGVVGHCRQGHPIYSEMGFCGRCEPEKL